MATPAPATFAQLLEQAVNEPGILSSAYRQFYGYSLGNVLLALSQCLARGIQPGPIATFQRWKELGRFVRRGEKAITLCRPVTVKRTTTADDGTASPRNGYFLWMCACPPLYRGRAHTQSPGTRMGSRRRSTKS